VSLCGSCLLSARFGVTLSSGDCVAFVLWIVGQLRRRGCAVAALWVSLFVSRIVRFVSCCMRIAVRVEWCREAGLFGMGIV